MHDATAGAINDVAGWCLGPRSAALSLQWMAAWRSVALQPPLKLQNNVERHDTVIAWLKRWTGPDARGAAKAKVANPGGGG